MLKPVLQIVIGSTRPGRRGPSIAAWMAAVARAHLGFTVEVLDLKAVGLPDFDEPNHPGLRQYVHRHTVSWSDTIARGDAFVLVVPEYNHGYNAATKNAIDFLHHEWEDKPVGFVSYGGVAAGTRAAQGLRLVFQAVKAVPVFESVSIPAVNTLFDADGTFAAPAGLEVAARAMLDELLRRESALAQLRNRPSS